MQDKERGRVSSFSLEKVGNNKERHFHTFLGNIGIPNRNEAKIISGKGKHKQRQNILKEHIWWEVGVGRREGY
jgi:hypothetical protein